MTLLRNMKWSGPGKGLTVTEKAFRSDRGEGLKKIRPFGEWGKKRVSYARAKVPPPQPIIGGTSEERGALRKKLLRPFIDEGGERKDSIEGRDYKAP